MTASSLDLDQHIRISDDVLAQEVSGETVLLDLKSEHYFGLDAVGTRIWQLLGENGDLRSSFEQLLEEYEVDAPRLEADLARLLEETSEAGLISLTPLAAKSNADDKR